MDKVLDILEKKGSEFYYVHPENTIFEALQKMAENDIGAVMVIDNGDLVGMFTERDYARKIILHGHTSKETKVGDFMTKSIYSVHPETSITDCMEVMTTKRVRHLPVIKQEKILGLISIGDVVNYVIQQKDSTIKHLENYIHGSKM